MNQTLYNKQLLNFLRNAPSPFHAVAEMKDVLQSHGFQQLFEQDAWQLQPGGRYFLTRNGASLIAFVKGSEPVEETGIRLIGAHTDSPCLKIKPQPDLQQQGYYQLGVEVYGGALLNPWFDRDLSLAGKVVFRDEDGLLKQTLIDFARPIATVPSLAIHLDREVNNQRSINPQKDIPPLLFVCHESRETDFRKLLLESCEEVRGEVLDFDLFCYDCQPPGLVGLYDEFIASARLDNLLSCNAGLNAIVESEGRMSSVLVCNDHEEVGSVSAQGAQGPMLQNLLQRLIPDAETRYRAFSRSLLISADNAHGIHPNYSDRHDSNHGPLLNKGPVIKSNANQRYATNAETAGLFRDFCNSLAIPVQTFVNRTDMGCGSTIGPLTAAEIGVPALDVGVPTFAMHSIRELAGAADAHWLYAILQAFCNTDKLLAVGD